MKKETLLQYIDDLFDEASPCFSCGHLCLASRGIFKRTKHYKCDILLCGGGDNVIDYQEIDPTKVTNGCHYYRKIEQ